MISGQEHSSQRPHSATSYVVVYVLLLILTATTYITGTQHLGKYAIFIALGIAATKSSLVVIFFMHLRDASAATRLVFALSLFFVALLITLAVSDVATRFKLATPAGAPFGTERSQPDGLLDNELPAEE